MHPITCCCKRLKTHCLTCRIFMNFWTPRLMIMMRRGGSQKPPSNWTSLRNQDKSRSSPKILSMFSRRLLESMKFWKSLRRITTKPFNCKKMLWKPSEIFISMDSFFLRLIIRLLIITHWCSHRTYYDLSKSAFVCSQNEVSLGGPQGESVMGLWDIFQSVKTGIGWKKLRYCVIDHSGIYRDW